MGSTIEPIPVQPAQPGERPGEAERPPVPSPPIPPLTASSVPAPSGRRGRALREIGYGLITAGVVVLLFIAYQLWGTGVAEANSQHRLRWQFDHLVSRFTTKPLPSPLPAATPPPTGEAVVHLVIPKIAVDKFVVEGVDPAELRKGPGHYPETPLPGEQGNAAIAAHRTTYGAPFYRLNDLHLGDDIYATTTSGRFHYRVSESRVVKPSDVSVLDPTPDNRLTLTTCTPRYSASRRLVVVSRLIITPAGGPTAPFNRVAPAPLATGSARVRDLGADDTAAWPPTILFGVVALGLWAGIRVLAATSAKRLRWIAFLIGIPVCLIPLWFFFENASRLLPTGL
jgi:sortase A